MNILSKKVRKHLTWGILALVLLAVVLFGAFKLYTKDYYRTESDVIAGLEATFDSVHTFSDENGMVFLPSDGNYQAVITFYPGGKVEYTAYSGLLYRLAEDGYVCLLPKMTDNLAILEKNAVEGMKNAHPEEIASVESLDWYLAGHSLGGVAASDYLADVIEKGENTYRGLILCASYVTRDFSGSDIRLLSVYGSNDKVLKMKSYEDSKAFWPKDSFEYVIEGGIHSFFGNYGIQDGDGEPLITNDEQLDCAADVIYSWIAGSVDEKSVSGTAEEPMEAETTEKAVPSIDREGVYTSKEDVALYIHTYGELPGNFITKKEAGKLGWNGGSLEDYAPGKCIGGDYFGNYEGLLPEEETREYRECDIDTLGKKRGPKRIIYSNDGYIYYTEDHYESFELLYGPED